MLSLPFGMMMLGTILYFALEKISLKTLFNPEAMLLVVAGCFGVLVTSAPTENLINLFKLLLGALKPEASSKKIDRGLLALSKSKESPQKGLHPLISYAQELWEAGVDTELFVVLLSHRLEELKHRTEGAVATLRNLSKFPPAMGMTGTVIGLVSLFSHLTPENRGNLGPSLALAMTATLYGLVVANMILLPLSDRMGVLHMERSKISDRVYGVLLLIHGGEPENVIQGELNVKAA
jgi:chemotaxis protein MotA